MQLETLTADTSTGSDLDHLVCCIAPVGELAVSYCGIEGVLAEPETGEPFTPSCVVCIDLERSDYCPHSQRCLYADDCQRVK